MKIFSIGHSNRTLAELEDALLAFGVEALADVRSIPRSKTNVQFNREVLRTELQKIGVEYHWMGPGLGGYRHLLLEDSPNTAWKERSFQSYADYATTDGFRTAISELESLALLKVTAFMCAERIYTSCHRLIISDHLAVRGWDVVHIMDSRRATPHRLTSFARVDGTNVTYPRRYEEAKLGDFI